MDHELLARGGRFALLALASALVLACAPAAAPGRSGVTSPPAPAATSAPAAASGAPAGQQRPAGDDQAVASFYRGKTVRVLVGTAAGGSYDLTARLIGRHLGRHIPGNPTIVVENMPGANNLVAANHMYNVGPKDGTLIQSYVGSLIVRQLFGAPGVEYDASRLHYIGAPATDSYVLVVTRKSGVARVEETFGASGKPLVLGTLGPGSPQEVGPALLQQAFGTNIRLVSGYDGGAKIRLAMENGEVDGTFTSWQEIIGTSREKVDSGEWQILSQATSDPIQALPNVPMFLDLPRTDEQRQLFRLATVVPYQFARPFVVAPEVPADRVRALEQAFARTMADPEFLADAERSQIVIAPVTSDAIRQRVLEFLAIPPDIREKLRPIMFPV